mgnify:CR=1 FL=1
MAIPVERANCWVVDEAICNWYRGVVVPIPTSDAPFRNIPTSGRVEVAHLELLPPQVVAPTKPEVMLRQLSANLSIRS